MKKNAYICGAKPIETESIKTYYRRDTALFLVLERLFRVGFAKTKGATLLFYITKILRQMRNRVKFGWSANNSNRVRFYGKTVIDGKVITSKKFRDAFSAMEWGKKQMNRACTGIYCITVSGAHVPMNVQFI